MYVRVRSASVKRVLVYIRFTFVYVGLPSTDARVTFILHSCYVRFTFGLRSLAFNVRFFTFGYVPVRSVYMRLRSVYVRLHFV